MTNLSKILITFIVLCQISIAVSDELRSPMIKEVLIIGSKAEKLKLPGSGIQISKEELQQHAYSDLNQIVSSVPGVYVREEDGYGLRPNIGIRGATSDRSQKITLMEDGVLIAPAPYSAPAAYYMTNASRINALEVLKGPAAIQYGPHTVGGAVNFVTRPVEMDSHAELDVAFGTDQYQKLSANLGMLIGDAGVLIDALRYSSDGFKKIDGGGGSGFVRNDFNVKVRWEFDTGRPQVLMLKLGFADEDSDETYLGLTDLDFENTPERRYSASQLDRFQSEHKQFHLNHTITLSSSTELNTKVYFNEFDRSWNKFDGFIDGPKPQDVLRAPNQYLSEYYVLKGALNSTVSENKDLSIDVTENDRSYSSQGIQFELLTSTNWLGLDNQVKLGFRFHEDDVRRNHYRRGFLMSSGDLISDDIDRGLKTNNYAKTEALALYLSDQVTWSDLTVTLGFRYEDIDGSVDNYLSDVRNTNSQKVTTPGLGIHWQLSDSLGLLAGIYAGYSPAGPGSTSAEPEETVNLEYGLRYATDHISAEVIGFFSDYSNFLGRCRASDSDCEVGQEFNGGAAEISGVEINSQVQIPIKDSLNVTTQFNYTYTESAWQDEFLSSFSQWGLVRRGDELPYIPKHVGRWQVGLESDRWSVNIALKYQHEMREKPGIGDLVPGEQTESLAVLDVSGTWFVSDNLSLKLMVRNLTNESAIVSHRPYAARPNLPRMVLGQLTYRLW